METTSKDIESRDSGGQKHESKESFLDDYSRSAPLSGQLSEQNLSLLKEQGLISGASNKPVFLAVLENKIAEIEFDPEKDIKIQIKEKTDSIIKNLETTYSVKIQRSGDDVVRQQIINKDDQTRQGEMLKARDPNLAELLGLEAALLRSKSTIILRKGPDELPPKIAFLDTLSQPHKSNTAAEYWWDDKQALVLFFTSKTLPKHSIAGSIETNGIHEFGHRHQDLMGWNPRQDDGGKQYIAAKLGWESLRNGKLALKGKDGSYYIHQISLKENPDKDGKTELQQEKTWLKVDKIGRFLDLNGKPVLDKGKAVQIQSAALKEMLAVNPASTYFDNPIENFTEGLSEFRKGIKSRFKLAVENPELYKEVAIEDQSEINRYYSEHKPASKGLRTAGGEIVDASPEQSTELARFNNLIELIDSFRTSDKGLSQLVEKLEKSLSKNMERLGNPGKFDMLINDLAPIESRLQKAFAEYRQKYEQIEALAKSFNLKTSELRQMPNYKLIESSSNLTTLLFALSMAKGEELKAQKYLQSLCKGKPWQEIKIPKAGSPDLDRYIDSVDSCMP